MTFKMENDKLCITLFCSCFLSKDKPPKKVLLLLRLPNRIIHTWNLMSVLTSAVALHVILAIIFQVAKVSTFPLSVNKINFDHLIY